MLVAALLVALLLVRQWLSALVESGVSPNPPVGDEWCVLASLFLAPWTAGLIVIELLPPRPRLRVLGRRPGFSGCFAALLALMMGFWDAMQDSFYGRSHFVPYPVVVAAAVSPYRAFLSVASVWAILAMSGRWRPKPSWTDRTGRLLVTAWLMNAWVWAWFF